MTMMMGEDRCYHVDKRWLWWAELVVVVVEKEGYDDDDDCDVMTSMVEATMILPTRYWE